jgi:ABC-type xylose transport system permease subunit
VPSFVVTLAGLLIWQGVIIKSLGTQGVIGIQDQQINDVANYVLTKNTGWIVAIVFTVGWRSRRSGPTQPRRAGLPTGNIIVASRASSSSAGSPSPRSRSATTRAACRSSG